MKLRKYYLLSTLLLLHQGGVERFCFAEGRLPHTNQYLSVSTATATPVNFQVGADISQYSIPEAPLNWGMDVAWDSEDNVIRGTNYIGKNVLNIGRVSFQPSDLIGADGQLSAAQKATLQRRLDHIALSGVKNIVLNCDHEVLMNKDNFPNCDQNYANYNGKPEEWYKVIKASVLYCRSKGFNVITISPFNEPDLAAWKEGSQSEFKAIAKLITEDPDLAGIRISAGNTLNCDQAASWYNAVKPYVTEGNTHQLAGSFDTYAAFWQLVRKDGNHATADELHNVGEAFIGAHYGMQSGIWWGWDGISRGEYCKASHSGKEIGYGENRKTWSAACVYKRDNGRVDAFLGTSERQATPSEYEFVATDAPSYFNGVGPAYTYTVAMPGGKGYQNGQTNAECMIQIHSGSDVPLYPIIAGKYVIMNANSKLCIGYYNNATAAGTEIAQRRYTKVSDNVLWEVDPIPTNGQGDLGYFYLRWGANRNHVIDIQNWSTAAGGKMIGYPGGLGTNEQWHFEYAGNNYWYIRSRHSGLYLEVKNSSTAQNGLVIQAEYTGKANQQWRFMPAAQSPLLELQAPDAPQGVSAQINSASIQLSWQANTEADCAGYAIYRNGNMIGRMIQGTEFLDNDVQPGVDYDYQVSAIDNSGNQSALSEAVIAGLEKDKKAMILHYTFETDTLDQTDNQLDPVMLGTPNYSKTTKKVGNQSLRLYSSSRCLMLPAAVGYYEQLSLATWVNVSSSSNWQRIFDFGNGTDQYFFLTPSNGSEMRLVMKNKGEEQILSATKLGLGWHHIAVTLAPDSVVLYVDGKSYKSTTMNIRLSDFTPKRNYIGRSQYAADPLMQGYLDDFRIYNFALTADQVQQIRNGEEVSNIQELPSGIEEATILYSLDGKTVIGTPHKPGLYISKQKKIMFAR